ncbi:MAG: phosphoribosylamine--glycine ligase [Euryarchaeota archaeon]|nr:phosphoribosylamine--glycine ligase [Euryarchaeota archaeon]
MKVLLVGHGAREHCIAEALDCELYSFMKNRNPGILDLSADSVVSELDLTKLGEFAKKVDPDFAFIGPEGPLEKGAVDYLRSLGIECFGPTKSLARIETSKAFTRELMEKYGINGNPEFRVFTETEGIEAYMRDINDFVVKPDGLTGGKGVKVFGEHLATIEEAVSYAEEVLKGHDSVVIEERLDGEEFSLQCISDGKHLSASIPVQDHKRAYEGDEGPNTGGMGSYSMEDHLLPFLTKKDTEKAAKITIDVMKALYKETGEYYTGILYGGFILTKNGVKLLEYNARLGDPEAMNILPILKNNFAEVCFSALDQRLKKMDFERKATVCKYVVPDGYPTDPKPGKLVIPETDARLYYASVDLRESGLYMTTSRAAAFVGIADTIDEAEKIAQNAVEKVEGGVRYRRDIGTQELLQRRVDHMKRIGEK